MLKVGQIETVEITGYTSEGLGVCRIDGCAVFVPNAIRGEVCEVAVSYVSRNSAKARITRLIAPSPHRINRLCPDGKRCGGCQLHHMDYEEELAFKARKVTDALNRIGGQSLALVPITGGDGITRGTPENMAAVQSGPSGTPAPANDSDPPHRGRVCPCGISASAEESEPDTGSHEAVPDAANCSDPPDRRGRRPRRPESDLTEESAVVPEACLCYRNKAQYPVQEQNGRVAAGFYRQRTHAVIPIQRCAILPPEFDAAKDVVLRWANENRVPAYDETAGTGLLRHIYVRKGFATGQVMVCIVAAGSKLPRPDRLISGLRQAVPGLASVVVAVNPKPGNAVLGDEFHTLFGTDEIEDVLCGFRFRLSPRSFYQVNPAQAQRLYEKAVSLADLKPDETVLDLYCGTGTITLALSRAAGRAIGVEIIPQAIADAKENARRSGVENAEFYCADAAEAARRFAEAGTRPDCIVVDPPRKGLSPDVIDAMAAMAPQRIVYVSCDPATLARDVKLLSEKGYALRSVEAVDMFPRTFHVETVVCLRRKNVEDHLEFTWTAEDFGTKGSKATYSEIQAYIQEKYGFKATRLNIAQIKRKCGIIERENYNLPKSENSRQPNCTHEKEAAIMDAFEHFQLIK